MAAVAVTKTRIHLGLRALRLFFSFSLFYSVPPGECCAGEGAEEADGFKEERAWKKIEQCGDAVQCGDSPGREEQALKGMARQILINNLIKNNLKLSIWPFKS